MKVLTGGKFNHIHPGHVWLLKKAKLLGRLVVVLAHDINNERPYALPAGVRKRNLEKLRIADVVVIGDKRPGNVVKKFSPDIIVLGYDQHIPAELVEEVKKRNIRVVRFKRHKDYSTRKIKDSQRRAN